MPNKPKTPQKKDLVGLSGRDQFQTPNYATDIISPYLIALKYFSPDKFRIWECAAGLGKIVNRLKFWGLDAFGTDLSEGVNFLTDPAPQEFDCIVTNPPFSLKQEFYEMCLGYGVPFALLLPADYSGWVIKATKDGCEKIIPGRRIDYITPNILVRIHEGEIWETLRANYIFGVANDFKKNELEEFKKEYPTAWEGYLEKYKDFCSWSSIYDVPAPFLKKYSSSYYHSMWLAKGFGLGRTETFVDLPKAQKLNI